MLAIEAAARYNFDMKLMADLIRNQRASGRKQDLAGVERLDPA
jgi:hypothetical protein